MTNPFTRGQPRNCNCGDVKNCRICAVKKAHEYRIAGDEEKYEEFYQVAVGLIEKERNGGVRVGGSNRRIR